jgi:hypothetical protein
MQIRLTMILSLFDRKIKIPSFNSDHFNSLQPRPLGCQGGASCHKAVFATSEPRLHFGKETFCYTINQILFLQYLTYLVYSFVKSIPVSESVREIVKLPWTRRKPQRSGRWHISKESSQYDTVPKIHIRNDEVRIEFMATLQSQEECNRSSSMESFQTNRHNPL